MLCPANPAPAAPTRIQLPRSSTRLQRPHVFVNVLERVKQEEWGAVQFEGRIYTPGQVVDFASLPSPLIAIECAGPVGVHQAKKYRDYLYILWRYDLGIQEWVEVARAQAKDASWTLALREPAIRALHPRPELLDIVARSRGLVDELVAAIDQRLVPEMPEVRRTVLDHLYTRVAGKIADCA
jgi:hypothetical protein